MIEVKQLNQPSDYELNSIIVVQNEEVDAIQDYIEHRFKLNMPAIKEGSEGGINLNSVENFNPRTFGTTGNKGKRNFND